jgi:hypothetical protein
MCGFVSLIFARCGCKLNRTTPEPKNGSIHLPCPFHWIFAKIKATSFVLIPWHLMGGISNLSIVLGKG